MNIYVGNLAFSVTQDELAEAFSSFGQVTSAKIIVDRETGNPRGFAFVEMPDQGEAMKAIQGMNGVELQGRTISVNEARPREPGRGPGGPRGGGSRSGGGFGGPRNRW